MSINEKNANTASEELINIPVNLSADELIEIPANLSNNTSSSSTTYAGASSRAIGCGIIQDNCKVTAQECNLCEIDSQGCSTTCEKFCENCEGDICEGCMTTCEVNASCQVGCQNCQGVACQTSCQTSCQKSC